MATAPCRDALEVIRVARSTVESQPIETAMGASTVLPGVPLPAWTLPAEVLPEPEPTAEAAPVEEHAESALEAAVLVASMAAANHAEAGDPPPSAPSGSVDSPAEVTAPVEDAVQIAAPPTRSLPAPEPAPAQPATPEPTGVVSVGLPVAAATALSESPATAPDAPAPWDQPAPDAPFAPHDTLAQIPAPPADAPADVEPRQGWDEAAAALGATAVMSSAAPDAPSTDEAVPHRHGHDDGAPAPEPARRRFGLRRKAATTSDDAAVPTDAPEAVDLPAPTDAALDLPAPVDTPLDLPAPTDAALDLPAPADSPLDLPAPVDPPVDAADAVDDEPTSRRPLVLLAAVGGVAVVAAVAAFVWPGLLLSHDDTANPAPGASVPTASAPVAPVTLQTPDTAAGYTKLTGAPATALAQAATGTTLDGFTAPVTAVYGANGVPKATVIAWAATSPASESTITSAFAGFVNSSGVAVTAISPVATGTLGGSMRCGVTTVQGAPATACFWADDASFGAVTVLSPATPADGATTATAIRLTVETRG